MGSEREVTLKLNAKIGGQGSSSLRELATIAQQTGKDAEAAFRGAEEAVNRLGQAASKPQGGKTIGESFKELVKQGQDGEKTFKLMADSAEKAGQRVGAAYGTMAKSAREYYMEAIKAGEVASTAVPPPTGAKSGGGLSGRSPAEQAGLLRYGIGALGIGAAAGGIGKFYEGGLDVNQGFDPTRAGRSFGQTLESIPGVRALYKALSRDGRSVHERLHAPEWELEDTRLLRSFTQSGIGFIEHGKARNRNLSRERQEMEIERELNPTTAMGIASQYRTGIQGATEKLQRRALEGPQNLTGMTGRETAQELGARGAHTQGLTTVAIEAGSKLLAINEQLEASKKRQDDLQQKADTLAGTIKGREEQIQNAIASGAMTYEQGQIARTKLENDYQRLVAAGSAVQDEMNHKLDLQREKVQAVAEAGAKRLSVLEQEKDRLTGIIQQEQQRQAGLKSSIGLSTPLERKQMLNVAQKINKGEELNFRELQFAKQHGDVFGSSLEKIGQRRFDQSAEGKEIFKLLGVDEKRQTAEKQREGVQGQINTQISLNTKNIDQAVKKIGAQFEAALTQTLQEVSTMINEVRNKVLQQQKQVGQTRLSS